ncbi:hypothetical protein [Chryseobacterium sp. YIM B08800]|uniref:hypothetical protein n=1 Tax=Chryseobacterium sp. YIM B08800 TaxID=2984136 RepID=UPI00224034CE|nr:hypothetical protein [Chryseobacterium sp. YIM B08800]
MKTIFLSIFLFLGIISYSQNNSSAYFNPKIDNIEKAYKYYLANKIYIFYGTQYKLHLIVKNGEKYYDLKFTADNPDNNYELQDITVLKNKELRLLFDIDSYVNQSISFDSEFYKKNAIKTTTGLPTYFSYNTPAKKRYGEYFLTVGISPVPMRKEVYNFLGLLLLDMIKK